MKEVVNYYYGGFVDYAGKKHFYTIAAAIEDARDLSVISIDNEVIVDCFQSISIGIAICNPEDHYDYKYGAKLAKSRALQADPVFFATIKANSKIIDTILQSTADSINRDPGKYIPGYNDAKKKYGEAQSIMQMRKNFTDEEISILSKVLSSPSSLDKIYKYVKFLKKNEQC